MPSRKKAKGRERKLKRDAKTRTHREAWTQWLESECSISCNHGYSHCIPAPDHQVAKFMNYCTILSPELRNSVPWRLFDGHVDVWNDDSLRTTAIDMSHRIGVNMILAGKVRESIVFARLILLLEQYARYNAQFDYEAMIHCAALGTARLRRDLTEGGEREAIRFYLKRISCSCLEEKYAAAKRAQPRRMALCSNCGLRVDLRSVLLCSRCSIHQYCCRMCQVSHWPKHKGGCNLVFNHRTAKNDQWEPLLSASGSRT